MRRTVQRVRRMSHRELVQPLIDTGILTRTGKLAARVVNFPSLMRGTIPKTPRSAQLPSNLPTPPFAPAIMTALWHRLITIDVSNHLHPHFIALLSNEVLRPFGIRFQFVRSIPLRLALLQPQLTDQNQGDCRLNPRDAIDHRHSIFRVLFFMPRQPLDKLGQ